MENTIKAPFVAAVDALDETSAKLMTAFATTENVAVDTAHGLVKAADTVADVTFEQVEEARVNFFKLARAYFDVALAPLPGN
jgi:hypothetical protein